MKHLPLVCAYLMMVFTVMIALYISVSIKAPPRTHLCGYAEVSPDMTPAEKERCRMLRMYKEGKTL